MNRFRKWRKRISVGFLSVFVLCLGMILTTGVVQADDIEDESLYARSNYIMQYFNEKTAPTEDEDSTPEGVTMAVVSFVDVEHELYIQSVQGYAGGWKQHQTQCVLLCSIRLYVRAAGAGLYVI